MLSVYTHDLKDVEQQQSEFLTSTVAHLDAQEVKRLAANHNKRADTIYKAMEAILNADDYPRKTELSEAFVKEQEVKQQLHNVTRPQLLSVLLKGNGIKTQLPPRTKHISTPIAQQQQPSSTSSTPVRTPQPPSPAPSTSSVGSEEPTTPKGSKKRKEPPTKTQAPPAKRPVTEAAKTAVATPKKPTPIITQAPNMLQQQPLPVDLTNSPKMQYPPVMPGNLMYAGQRPVAMMAPGGRGAMLIPQQGMPYGMPVGRGMPAQQQALLAMQQQQANMAFASQQGAYPNGMRVVAPQQYMQMQAQMGRGMPPTQQQLQQQPKK